MKFGLKSLLTSAAVAAVLMCSSAIANAADFRIDGRIVMSPVFREPILGGSLQVSDKDLTIERARSLAAQISAAKGIEIEVPSD